MTNMKTADPFSRDRARDDALILVDGLDRPIGTATKMQAHVDSLLHRAFSVVLMREGQQGIELLLAQRAAGKYHSAGLWANSCCSHPRAGESLAEAVPRRLQEELGCGARDLTEIGAFVYRACFADGLFEYEYDHVFVGTCEGDPQPDPDEVGSLRWVTPDQLAQEFANQPEQFAAWAYTVLSLALAFLHGEDTGC